MQIAVPHAFGEAPNISNIGVGGNTCDVEATQDVIGLVARAHVDSVVVGWADRISRAHDRRDSTGW